MIKKICILIIVSMSFFFVGCDSDTDKRISEKSFNNELVKFSENPIQVFNIDPVSNESTLNRDAFENLIEYVNELGVKYDFQESIEVSGDYASIDESFAYMGYYETMEFLAKNSTPEFYNNVIHLINTDVPLENNKIINSTAMLPNERLALIVLNNSFGIGTDKVEQGLFKSSASGCVDTYNSAMGVCRNNLLIKAATTLVFTRIHPLLGVAAGLATAIDHDTCTSQAFSALLSCLN